MKRYSVRRFCPAGTRPDCFEVFDTTTGKGASFGMRKPDAVKVAGTMNEKPNKPAQTEPNLVQSED